MEEKEIVQRQIAAMLTQAACALFAEKSRQAAKTLKLKWSSSGSESGKDSSLNSSLRSRRGLFGCGGRSRI